VKQSNEDDDNNNNNNDNSLGCKKEMGAAYAA